MRSNGERGAGAPGARRGVGAPELTDGASRRALGAPGSREPERPVVESALGLDLDAVAGGTECLARAYVLLAGAGRHAELAVDRVSALSLAAHLQARARAAERELRRTERELGMRAERALDVDAPRLEREAALAQAQRGVAIDDGGRAVVEPQSRPPLVIRDDALSARDSAQP